MLAISLFVVYRYVKSLEKQMNQLSLQIDIFNTDINKIKQKELISKLNVPDLLCESLENILTTHVEHEIPMKTCPITDAEDEEKVSVCDSISSEELMNIVHNIDSEQEDIYDTIEPLEEEPSIEEQLEEEPSIEEQLEEEQLEEEQLEEELIEREMTHEELSKLTNEDLKKILKRQNMSTKGTKVELVKRILESV
jgi:hypothetical protein